MKTPPNTGRNPETTPTNRSSKTVASGIENGGELDV